MWTHSDGLSTIAIPAWPLAMLAAAIVCAFVGGAGLHVRAFRMAPRPNGLLAGFAAFVVVAAGVCCVGLLPLPLAVVPTHTDTVAGAFAWVIGLQIVMFGMLAMALAAGAARVPWSVWPTGHWPWTAPFVAALGLSGFLAAPAWFESAAITLQGPVPTLDTSAARQVQIGRTLTLAPTLDVPGWALDPIPPFVGATAGSSVVTVHARGGIVSWQQDIPVDVQPELGTLAFPLVVGEQWAFAPFSATGASPRVLFSGGLSDHERDEKQVTTLTVTGVNDSGPLRTFTVELVKPDKTKKNWTVYAWNGEVRTVDTATEPGTTFAGPLATPLPDPWLQSSMSCDVAVFDGLGCGCAVPGSLGLEGGPTACQVSSGGGLGWGLVRGLLTVATLGIVDPGSDYSANGFDRIGYQPGTGPSAPPLWTKVSADPTLDADVDALGQASFDDEKLVVLRGLVAKRHYTGAEAVPIVSEFAFDEGKTDAIAAFGFDHATEERLLPLLAFDDARQKARQKLGLDAPASP